MAIYLPFKKLSSWQQRVLAAGLVERMLPNYQMFSQAVSFGDYKVLRNQLDLLWQKLSKLPVKVSAETQLDKLEEQIPEVEQFDFFGVYPALDVCMALTALWQSGSDKTTESIEQVSRLSYNSVSAYVELMLEQELEEGEEVTEASIKAHPLTQWERETQSELFDYLKTAPETQETCQQVKKMVLSEGVTNLGIEI